MRPYTNQQLTQLTVELGLPSYKTELSATTWMTSRLMKPNEPEECREQLFRQTCQSALMQPIVAIELFQTLRPFIRSRE
jgi:hypothetical protein